MSEGMDQTKMHQEKMQNSLPQEGLKSHDSQASCLGKECKMHEVK